MTRRCKDVGLGCRREGERERERERGGVSGSSERGTVDCQLTSRCQVTLSKTVPPSLASSPHSRRYMDKQHVACGKKHVTGGI